MWGILIVVKLKTFGILVSQDTKGLLFVTVTSAVLIQTVMHRHKISVQVPLQLLEKLCNGEYLRSGVCFSLPQFLWKW